MIKIKIGSPEEEKTSLKTELQIRKSLDGKLIITDHEDLDIVIDQDKGKVLAFSTDMKNSDKTYYTQDRFFKHMIKKGVVDPESVKASNIYGCMEGSILKTKDDVNAVDLTILAIDKWIDQERPSFLYQKAKEEEFERELTEPDKEGEDVTELGSVKHKVSKFGNDHDIGSMFPTQKPY